MDLRDAKLGDVYRIFTSEDKTLADYPTLFTMLATVIATKKPGLGKGFILGWKKDQEHPEGSASRSSTSSENEYVPNQADYVYGVAVVSTLLAATKVVNGLDGMFCRRCGNFSHYAVPNRPDGTLLCWSCRNTW